LEQQAQDQSDETDEFWIAVHEDVQKVLEYLAVSVLELLPEVQVVSGFTQGTGYYLFSYKTFFLAGSEIDPVVAGVTFSKEKNFGVSIEADISGEQRGDLISLPITIVSSIGRLQEKDAMYLAFGLGALPEYAEQLVAALRDTARVAE
jgi:hypothetical protein